MPGANHRIGSHFLPMGELREASGAEPVCGKGAGKAMNRDLVSRMKKKWEDQPFRRIPTSGKNGAAVMLCLIPREGEYRILFEVRAMDLDRQPGEICFPGGAIEDGETPLMAAVREATEELRITEGEISVIAPLFEIESPGGGNVWCFLAELPEYAGTFSRDEVDHVLEVPLGWFFAHPARQAETFLVTEPGNDYPFELIPGGRNYPFRRTRRIGYFYDLAEFGEKTSLWGMTAMLVHAFLVRLRRDFPEYAENAGFIDKNGSAE